MEGGEAGSSSGRQIRVRFVTNLPDHLKVPTTSIAVPVELTRLGLSEVVNALLDNGKPQPFDFLIDGELVRMSLERFLLAKGISAEKVLDIEYIYAVAPRKAEDPCLHNDWVSAVDGSNPSFILTGCYDHYGRIWKEKSICTHILEGHNGAITDICSVKTKDGESTDSNCVATASKDRTLRLWKFDVADEANHPVKRSSYKTLRGHTLSVQSVSASPEGDMVCSGSWDSCIKVWQTRESDAEGSHVYVKKRKSHNSNDSHQDSQEEGEAVSTISGHSQCVSSVVWPDRQTIYSASWDHSIRMWDVQTGKESLNLVTGKALNCVDVGGESSVLIAAGASDPVIRIWDPRKPGTFAPVFQFSSHTSWITACKWHKISWFHLVSSSYDGRVMIWDLRTAWPLAILDSHKDKVLCVDWWRNDDVISGGADSQLCISRELCIS